MSEQCQISINEPYEEHLRNIREKAGFLTGFIDTENLRISLWRFRA